MTLIDANIVLRYLLDDHPVLSDKATKIIENNAVVLPIEAACEVVYVLQKVYAVEKEQIKQQLSALVMEDLVIVEKRAVFLKALACFALKSFDFVDTLLWAYHVVEEKQVLTFDKKLNKLIQNTDISLDE